ncbi:MAG TPA: calcium/sodium antiporter [Acidimicrobiia bacterium]|nr:calcium/sodium antiporter [Acidimicrobiia bacterium]
MLLAIAGVIVGLAILTYSADQFVIGAARVAISMRLSKVVVGAVVIGFGTSTPEMLVSALAGVQGSLDLAVGNIVGSNIANLTLVLGAAALVTPITVEVDVLRREALLSFGLVAVFAFVLRQSMHVRDGVVLAVLFLAALTFIIIDARRGDDSLGAEVDEYLADGAVNPRTEWTRTILGLIGTLGAAQILVTSASEVASQLGMAEGFIGLTVVAVGTSLPELAASLQAARKDETDLIVGNLLGSNLFNAGAVGAIAAITGSGQQVSNTISTAGVFVMLGGAAGATLFMATGRRVTRTEGAVLLAAYVATVPLMAG